LTGVTPWLQASNLALADLVAIGAQSLGAVHNFSVQADKHGEVREATIFAWSNCLFTLTMSKTFA